MQDKDMKNIEEAMPMGWAQRLGARTAKLTKPFAPNIAAQAKGSLATGNLANTVMKAYANYRGQTGEASTVENVLAFLQKNNYPLTKASELAKTISIASDNTEDKIEPSVAETSEFRKYLNIINEAELTDVLNDKQVAQIILAAVREHAANVYAQQKAEPTTTTPTTEPAASGTEIDADKLFDLYSKTTDEQRRAFVKKANLVPGTSTT